MDTLVAMAGAVCWLVAVQAPPAGLTMAHGPRSGPGLQPLCHLGRDLGGTLTYSDGRTPREPAGHAPRATP